MDFSQWLSDVLLVRFGTFGATYIGAIIRSVGSQAKCLLGSHSHVAEVSDNLPVNSPLQIGTERR